MSKMNKILNCKRLAVVTLIKSRSLYKEATGSRGRPLETFGKVE